MKQLRLIKAPAVAAVFILLGAVSGASAADKAKDGYGELTVNQVEHLVETKGAAIFDNDSQERWQKSHVPGATWVAYDAVKASDLPQDKGRCPERC